MKSVSREKINLFNSKHFLKPVLESYELEQSCGPLKLNENIYIADVRGFVTSGGAKQSH